MYKLLVIFSLLGLLSCQNPPENNDPAIVEEALVYIASRGDGFNLYKWNLATSTETQLTNAPGWEWAPQFMADKQIILHNSQDTSGNFSVKSISTEGQQASFPIPDVPDLAISPNGQWITFIRKKGEAQDIKLAPISNLSDSLTITPDSAYHGRVKWSFDSERLAFISDQSGANEVYMYDLATAKTTRLTSNTQREKYLSWSPDGKKLACTMRTDSTENEIVLIDITTKGQTQLTQTSWNESEIAWSPSGRYLAYHAQVEEEDNIFLIELATDQIIQLTKNNGYHGEPAWIWK